MSIETFDWQGYMSDIGYAPEQIPNEINDEDREWLYGLWARDLMEQINYEVKQNPFFSTAKEKASEARRQFLQYAPDLSHLFGEEVQPNDPNTTFDPEAFRQHVVNNEVQNANLGYYLDTFAASRINEDTDVKWPWLKGLTKDQFKKSFMEQQDIDEAWTSVDDIRNGNFGTLAANYQAQLAQQQGLRGDEKSGHMAALKQGWYEFEKLFGYTAGTLGDATGIQWLSDIGNEIAQNVIQKSDAYNYQSKYNQSLADTIKNEGVMAAGGKILNMAEENWATTAAPLALAAIGKILSTYAHVPQPLADAATRAVAANVVRRQGANLLRRASQLAYGSSAALSGLEIGGVRAELEEHGKYDPNNVLDVVAGGLVSSSLDFIGNVAAMKGLTITASRLWTHKLAVDEARARLAKEIAGDQAKSFTHRVLSAMATEGVTEGLQEIPAMVVGARRGIEYTSKEVRDRIIDAAAVGAFMGGGIRAGEIALEKYHRGDEESPTDTDADETPETPDAPEAPPRPSQPPPPDFDGEMPFNNVTYRPTENGFVAADPFNVGYGATRNEAAEDFLKNANKGRVDIDANDIRSVPPSATEEGSSIVRYGNNDEHSVRVIGQGSNALIRKIIDIHNNPKNAVNLQGHNTFNVSDFQSTNPDLNEDQFIRSVLEQKKTGRGSSNDVILNRTNAVDIPVNLTAVPRTDIAGSYAAFNLDQDSRDALRDKGFTILSNPKSRENGRIQRLLLYRNGFVYTVTLRNSATDDNVSAVVEAEHIKDINARRQIKDKDQNKKARNENIKRNSFDAGVKNQTLRVVTTDPVTDVRSISERKSSITIAPVLRAGFVELNRKVNAEGVEEFTIDPRKILEKRIKDANGKIEKVGARGITYTNGGETTRLDITADGRVVVSTDGRFVGDYEFFDPADLTEGERRASFQSTRIEATQPFNVIDIPEELQFDGRVTFVYEGDENTPENQRNYYAIRNNGDVYYISPAEDNYIKRLLRLQYIQNLNDARDVFGNQFIEFYALPSFYEDGDVNQFVGFKTENNLLPVVNLEDPTLHRFSNMEVDDLISAGYNGEFVKVYAIIAPNGEVVRATTEEGVDTFIEDIKGYANILDDSEWNPSSRKESIFGDAYTERGLYTEEDLYGAGYETFPSDEGITDDDIIRDNDKIREASGKIVDQIGQQIKALRDQHKKGKYHLSNSRISEYESVLSDLERDITFSESSTFNYYPSTVREINENLRRRFYAMRTAQAMLHIDLYRNKLGSYTSVLNREELDRVLANTSLTFDENATIEELRKNTIQVESIAVRLEEAYIKTFPLNDSTKLTTLLWQTIYSDPVEGNYGSFVNRIHSEGTDFRFSRAAETPRVRRRDSILNELQKELGDFTLDTMLEKGLRGESGGLVILPDQEAAHDIERMFTTDATQPYYDDEGLIQGFVAPDGMIYLVEDGIVDGKARQIILHEYGVHARKFGMTDAQFQEVVQNIKAKRDEKSLEGDFVRHAITRAKRANKNMSEDNPIFWEEVAAYAVEDGYHLADTGIVGRMQTWMKNWLWRFGVIDATAFHYQDFVNMAQGMLGNPGPLSFFDGTHDYTKYQDSWKNIPKFSRTILAEDTPDREEFAQRTYRRLRGLDDAIDRERNGEDADSIEQATDWRRNDQGDWGIRYSRINGEPGGESELRYSRATAEELKPYSSFIDTLENDLVSQRISGVPNEGDTVLYQRGDVNEFITRDSLYTVEDADDYYPNLEQRWIDYHRDDSESNFVRYSRSIPETNLVQRFTSQRTSLPQNDPALYKNKWFLKELKEGSENFDIGAGITTKPTERLASLGVRNVPFDPFNREQSENAQAIQDIVNGKRYPTVTVANVLNVIAEPESRSNVILQAAKALDENGKAFFDVYVAPREGETSIGTYQTAMRPEEYLPEIERWFDDVERHGSVIIASSPKEEVNTTEAVWWDANPQLQGNIIRYSRAATIDDVPQTTRQRGTQVPNAPGMYKMPDGSLHIEPSELPVGFESETILYAAIAVSDPAKEEPRIAELRGLILTDPDLMRETDRMMRERNDTNEDHRLGYAVSLILEAYDPTSDIYQQTVDAFHEAVSKATGGAYQNLILDTGQIEAAAHAAAGIPYEALLTAPHETVPTPRPDTADVQRQQLEEAFANSDAQREYMQVGEDGRAFIATDDSDVDVVFESKVTNPFDVSRLTDDVLVGTTEHNESDDFYNHLADSPTDRTQEPLDTGRFTAQADTMRNEVEAFLASVLPEHIWNRMQILWEDNADNRKLLDNALGKFTPKAWQNKNILIRGWDRSFGQVVRTAGREASRFGWGLWQNRDFRKALTDFYDMFTSPIYNELTPYYNQMGVIDPTKLTNGQKIFMVQTFFSKLNQSLFTDDATNMADILGIDAQEYKRVLANVKRGISAQENDLSRFMSGVAGNPELAKQFASEMLRMTMETATNVGTHFVYERANTLGGRDRIRVYTNEWGTWRNPEPNTRFGKVAEQIKKNLEWWHWRYKGNPRAEKFARWMMRNLPMNFKLMKLFHLYVPDARLGDTTLGKASQMISRVWQRIGDMSGTTIQQDYALMEDIHGILRDYGYDPLVANDMFDQTGRRITYEQFFRGLGITSAKAMEKARLADEVVRTAEGLRKEQAANIRSMIVETGVSLYNRMVNAGVPQRNIQAMVNDFERKRQKFHDNYAHRMYEAFTPEGKSELARMLHYLKRDPATGELTIAKRAKQAEEKIRQAEARYGRGTSQFYKETAEARADLRRYERLTHLQNFVKAVLRDKKRLFGAELNEAVVAEMKNTINAIILDAQSIGRIDAQAVPHYNSISAQKARKLNPENDVHRELMAFLSEIEDPMRVAVYSADQQRQIIAKLQFNKELGEYLVDNGMATIRGVPSAEGIARDLAQMESGTFLEYINVDPAFMPEIKAEYENMQKVTETVLGGLTDAVKANSTVYSLRLAMNNYIGNASMLLASGHFWRFGNWMEAGGIVRKQFLDRFTYGAKDPSDFGKMIIKEMEDAMVTGGSGTEMSVFQLNKGAHENFVQMMTGLLYSGNLLSRAGKFKFDNFVKRALEYARKFYTYGDEWVKPLMYINNRMNAIAKYEAIEKRRNGETEEEYKERVLKKAIEEASEMTIRETVSWENSPFFVRQLSTKSTRFFVPDFLLHNFQMLRITASNYVRLMELGRELANFNPTEMNSDKVDAYRSALKKEFAQRSVGGAMTAGVYAGLAGATGSCMAFIPYMMNTLMSAIDGEDDKDKDNTFFNPQEWEGAQRILNYKTGGDNFFVPAWKHNGKIYAWNYGRASVMLTHAIPQPATENPEFTDYAAQFFKNIVNIGGGTIAQEIVNNAQGKDKWGREIGMEAGWGRIFDRVIVPGAVRQLLDMSVGYPGSSDNPYREGKAIKMSDAVGITVNAYDMRDIVNEVGWNMGRVGSNSQNVARKSFVKRLTESDALSDSQIASLVSDMRESNARDFDKANYVLTGLRQMGMENKEIAHWLTVSRKDANTILPKKQANAFLKGQNIYDENLVTYLKNRRNNLAKGQDDVRMSKEELAVVLQNYDKAIRMYSQALRAQ